MPLGARRGRKEQLYIFSRLVSVPVLVPVTYSTVEYVAKHKQESHDATLALSTRLNRLSGILRSLEPCKRIQGFGVASALGLLDPNLGGSHFGAIS